MAYFTARDVMRRISEIEAAHGRALGENISDEFPNDACGAYTLAVGFSVVQKTERCDRGLREREADGRCIFGLATGSPAGSMLWRDFLLAR